MFHSALLCCWSSDRNGIQHVQNLCYLSPKVFFQSSAGRKRMGWADPGSPWKWLIKWRRQTGELRVCECHIICWNTTHHKLLWSPLCIKHHLFFSPRLATPEKNTVFTFGRNGGATQDQVVMGRQCYNETGRRTHTVSTVRSILSA